MNTQSPRGPTHISLLTTVIWVERIERGLNQHTLSDLMLDVVRLGIISHAELTAHLVSRTLAGTATDDAFRKYLGALGGGRGSGA